MEERDAKESGDGAKRAVEKRESAKDSSEQRREGRTEVRAVPKTGREGHS